MKKKSIIVTLIITVLSLSLLVGCQRGPTPEDNLDNFFVALKDIDLEGVSSTVHPNITNKIKGNIERDSQIKFNIDIESLEKADGFDSIKYDIKKLFNKLEYKVISKKLNEAHDEVEMKVQITYADAGVEIVTSMAELFHQVIGKTFTGAELTEEESTIILADILDVNLKSYKLKEKKALSTIRMTKSSSSEEWLISTFDKYAINAVMFGVPNTINEMTRGVDEGFTFDNRNGNVNSSETSDDESLNNEQLLENEELLSDIHAIIINTIKHEDEIDYDNFIEKKFDTVKKDIKKITSSKVEVGLKDEHLIEQSESDKKDVIYIMRDEDKKKIIVYTFTEYGLIQYDGETK